MGERRILHVDMDAFFASVEIRERPELAERPVAVGGRPEARGVVAAANYVARRYGVRSAIPMSQAMRLCPGLVVLPPRHGHYAVVSAQINAIFHRYTPLVEPLSLDEAFLDVGASESLFGPSEAIGRRIKWEIYEELGLVASVGVAPNKFLAKLASDLDKPDGFLVVPHEGIQGFLDPLPVGRIWGVGRKAAERMERLGIRTVAQLRAFPAHLLADHFGSQAAHFLQLARGLDDRPVVSEHEAKSISNETTFSQDIEEREVLRAWLVQLSEQVGARLRAAGVKGRTVQLKVRFADFTTVTRAQSLPVPTDVTAVIRDTILALFVERLPAKSQAIRLLGVGVSGFAEEPAQAELFDETAGRREVDTLVDRIRERFGRGALNRGQRPDKSG